MVKKIPNLFLLFVPLSYFIFFCLPINSIVLFFVRIAIVAVYALLGIICFLRYSQIDIVIKISVSPLLFSYYIGVFLLGAHFSLNLFLYLFLQRISIIYGIILTPFLSYIPSIFIIIAMRNYEARKKTINTIFSKPIYQQLIILVSYLFTPFAAGFLWYKTYTVFIDNYLNELMVQYVFAAICLILFTLSCLFMNTDKITKIICIALNFVIFSILFSKSIHYSLYWTHYIDIKIDTEYQYFGKIFALSIYIVPLIHFFSPGSYFTNILKFGAIKKDEAVPQGLIEDAGVK